MKNRQLRDIAREFKKFQFSEIPAAAVVSSIAIEAPGKIIFSNNEASVLISSADEKKFIYWQIYKDSLNIWKDISRIVASTGVKNFIFIGKYPEMNDKPPQAYIIKDHINLSGENPLIGPNNDALGSRFPDMTELYNKDLSTRLKACCESAGINTREATLMIPRDLNIRTELEQKILMLRDDIVLSKDVFEGAIVAKHQSLRSAGLFLCETVSGQQKSTLLNNIFRMF
ncbi:MAG: hypothetical protein Q7J65_05715 [Candidatus Marinimicrobia bacterium]|nr:hypothetical protein [Candidatus Neomarinimicrobiota bacterium]